jgi:DNA-binding MarR family transcriptional regulator
LVNQDAVDRIVEQWSEVRPELDVSPMSAIGRISRLSRLIDRRLAENFQAHGVENWMYDVLATLRRSGAPFQLSPTELVAHTMVTTGAMTNRIDRLQERGLVERSHSTTDRRRVVVQLTETGLDLVDAVAESHYRFEAQLLTPLTANQQANLVNNLRRLLLYLDDVPGPRRKNDPIVERDDQRQS